MLELLAQIFGIAGFIFAVISFQEKNNKRFFIEQGLSGLMFFLNFIFIGAVSAALLNLANLVRGALFAKNDHKPSRLIIIEILYTACFVFSLTMIYNDPKQIILSSLTFFALAVMTVFMWLGNGKNIRYAQLSIASPAWLIHNIFNFSLGGILCEVFAIISVIVSFIRYGKDGFESR